LLAWQATHSAVISDAELMSLLTLAFDVPSFKVGTALAKLLTGLAILPDPLNTAVVLEAFSAGRLLTGDRFRFQRLVDCLGSHDDWEGVDNAYAIDEHRFSVLLFIGRLCAADIDDVEARVLLRDEFERTGMKEQMVVRRAFASAASESPTLIYPSASGRPSATPSRPNASSTASRTGKTTQLETGRSSRNGDRRCSSAWPMTCSHAQEAYTPATWRTRSVASDFSQGCCASPMCSRRRSRLSSAASSRSCYATSIRT
jgi:hypothetical protein